MKFEVIIRGCNVLNILKAQLPETGSYLTLLTECRREREDPDVGLGLCVCVCVYTITFSKVSRVESIIPLIMYLQHPEAPFHHSPHLENSP